MKTMKKIAFFILLGLISSSFALNAQESQREVYQNKVVTFTKMKRAGLGLTIGGAVVTTAGIGLLIDGSSKEAEYDYNSPDYDDATLEMLLGYCSTAVGLAATSGGIVLLTIGSSKAKQYNQKLKAVSLNLNPAPNRMIALAFRF